MPEHIHQQQMDSKVNKGGGSQAAEAGVGPAVGGPGGAGDQLQEIVNRWAS